MCVASRQYWHMAAIEQPNTEDKTMATTHVEVTKANGGAAVYGIADGDLLDVVSESPNFFIVKARNNRPNTSNTIKISKHTKRACRWSNPRTSPAFNV
jgi:hypothetical protein